MTWGDLSSEVPKDTYSQIPKLTILKAYNSKCRNLISLKPQIRIPRKTKQKGGCSGFILLLRQKQTATAKSLSRKQVVGGRLTHLSCSSVWEGSQGRNLSSSLYHIHSQQQGEIIAETLPAASFQIPFSCLTAEPSAQRMVLTTVGWVFPHQSA